MVSFKLLLAALPFILQVAALPTDVSADPLLVRQDECIAPTNCGAPVGYVTPYSLLLQSEVKADKYPLVIASSVASRRQTHPFVINMAPR